MNIEINMGANYNFYAPVQFLFGSLTSVIKVSPYVR